MLHNSLTLIQYPSRLHREPRPTVHHTLLETSHTARSCFQQNNQIKLRNHSKPTTVG